MKIHEKYIKRCIEIAKNGLGSTAPNPMVGCVIVYEDLIIAEGCTSAYGGSHAEVNAINKVKNKALLKNSILYVSLEPCSHFGKTPPCSDLIIKHQIKTVVIGCLDSNPLVAGKGIEKLRKTGIEVITGVLEQECRWHHKRFFTFHEKLRPYIILKWAQTADGFIAPLIKQEKKPVWITNTYSRQLVHKWRTEEQSILVGTKTVIEDNPYLTSREWFGRNPIRIVLDPKNSLTTTYHVFSNEAQTIKISSVKNTSDLSKDFKQETLIWDEDLGVAEQICNTLKNHHINSVIIEGGAKTLQTFIDENLWDEARIFKGTNSFGGGTKSPRITGRIVSTQNILSDTLTIIIND